MDKLLIGLAVWAVLSVPVSLIIGRVIRRQGESAVTRARLDDAYVEAVHIVNPDSPNHDRARCVVCAHERWTS